MDQSPNKILNQAIHLAKGGDKQNAARLLAEVLRQQPNNETAWLWLAAVISDPEKQIYCLERAVAINPTNERARQALYQMRQKQAAGTTPQRSEGLPQAKAVQHEAPDTIPVTEVVTTNPMAEASHEAPIQDTSKPAGEPPPPAAASEQPEVKRPGRPARAARTGRTLALILLVVVVAVLLYLLWIFLLKPSLPPGSALALVTSPFSTRVQPGGGLAEAISRAAPGSTISLGPGDYTLDQTLEIHKPVTITGAGIDKTRLVLKHGGIAMHVQGIGPFVFKNLEFLYAGDQSADLIVADSGILNITDSRISGAAWDDQQSSGGRGLVLQGTSSGTITRTEVVNNGLHGIYVGNQANPDLIENLVHGNGGNGIEITGQAQPLLDKNELAENSLSGIVFTDQSGGKAVRNTARDNYQNGVEIQGSARPLLTENTLIRNLAFGILVDGQAQPMLLSNTAQRNSKAGIAFLDQAGGAAQGNDCSSNEMHGISVNDYASPYLKENRCTRNKQVGIDYWGSARGTAANNECSENGLQGIALHENAAPALENNICSRNSDSGIIYWGNSAGKASNNECSNNSLNGISVHNLAQPQLERNSCSGNARAAIAYFDRSGGLARENECSANGQNAIVMLDQANPVLESNPCRKP